MEDWNEDVRQFRLLNLPSDAWIKPVSREEVKGAKSNHTVKKILNKEHHKRVVNCTRSNVARDDKTQFFRTPPSSPSVWRSD